MSWGLLIDPRPSVARPFAQVTEVSPPQEGWFDPARLLDPQPRARLRLRCDAAGFAAIALDLGAPAEAMTHAALISTTLAAGTLRLAGSAASPTVAVAEAFDTGPIAADGLAEPAYGAIALPLASAGPAQFVRVELAGQVPLAWVDLGLVLFGAAVVPPRQWQFGASFGRIDGGAVESNPSSGASFGRPGAAPRVWEFDVPHARAELIGAGAPLLDRLDRLAADKRDVLVIPDLADMPAVMSRRAVWGRLEGPPAVLSRFDVVRRRWRVLERI